MSLSIIYFALRWLCVGSSSLTTLLQHSQPSVSSLEAVKVMPVMTVCLHACLPLGPALAPLAIGS